MSDTGLDAAALQQLFDRQAICDCITRLARGMDRHDAELMQSSYHVDALDDHGPFIGPAHEFIEYVNGGNEGEGIHDRLYSCHQHYVMNHLVEIDGDDAHAETYFLFVGELRRSSELSMSGGRYLDRLTRRDGRWAIAVRRVVIEWATVVPKADGGRAGVLARFTPARQDRSDASYERPLQPRSRRDDAASSPQLFDDHRRITERRR